MTTRPSLSNPRTRREPGDERSREEPRYRYAAPRAGGAPVTEQAIDRRPLVGPRLAADSWTMAWRLLKATPRQPELLMFSTIQTIMFVLLFRYVFGGAIETGGIPYVQFLMPGIFVQTLAFNGAVTGIGMADDMAKSIVDRFRSMPIP